MAAASLSFISLSELAAANLRPFAALYGRDDDRRSTFIARWIQRIAAEEEPQPQQRQCIFLLDGHRALQFAQQHHATEPFAPFMQDLQLLGVSSGDQFDFQSVSAWTEPFAISSSAKSVLVLEDRSASHHNTITPLGEYLAALSPLIEKNAEAGVHTVLVVDHISAFSDWDLQTAADVRNFREEFVQKRLAKNLSILMAPKTQDLDCCPELANLLDFVLFADNASTYLGMKQWQRVYFRPFGVFTTDQELVSLFDGFQAARTREEDPEFQALVMHKVSRINEFAGSSPLYLEKISLKLS